jgi:hypothetical protein
MTTVPPSEDEDRATKLEGIVEEMILKIMLNLNQHGYSTAEILAALDDVCDKRHREYQEDPDPADDPKNEVVD